MAVYSRSPGTVTVCDWAPPSDQDPNTNGVPARFCGDGAAIVVVEPSISERVKGAGPALGPRASDSPVGLERIVTETVRGSRRTVWVSVSPPASLAVRLSSRCEGYS